MVNVGIIGFGRIGAEHAGWLSRTKAIRPVAVADATPARQAIARQRGLVVFDTIESCLADREIDAVLIATPTAMHFEHVSLALSAGKHVMVEKPMAMDFPQAQQLVEQARTKGRVLSVFHNRRWDADFLAVLAMVKSGVLGKLINVESRLGQFSSCVGPAAKEYRPGWRNEAAFGGGGLYDWGSHFVDQIWRLLWPARPLRVFAQLRGNVWSSDCDDFARVLIDFDHGVVALVEINTTTAAPLSRWHLDGTNGSATSPHSAEFDTNVWADVRFAPGNARDGGDAGAPQNLTPETGLTEADIWERFAAAVRGEGPPAVTPASVLPTMQLLDAARRSSREGVAVAIDARDWEM